MKPPTPPSRPWPQIVLAAAVLITFGRLVPYEFLQWDDPFNLTANGLMNPVTWRTFTYYWTHSDFTLYMPVTYSVWAVLTFAARVSVPDVQGVTLNPMVFRLCNVLVHTGSALLVFAILKRLTKHDIAALLGAMVYALHPVQVESVGWIAGLKDLLWGFFSFGAIYLYICYTTEPRRRAYYFGGMLLLVMAMLSKPTAMVTPALVIVIDWVLLRRPWKRIAIDAGPWLALSLPCAIIARMIQTGARSFAGPLWARPLIVADSLTFYAGKLLWPMNLAPDYCHRPAVVIPSGALAWTWIVPVLLASIAVWQFRRRPWIAAGLLLFVIGTAPTLGWIPFSFQFYSTTADHYLYVSMLGIGIIVSHFIATTVWPANRVVGAIAIVIALLAGRSIWQAHIWADTHSLFTHTLKVTPDSFIARIQLAAIDADQSNFAAAEPKLWKAIELGPTLPRGYLVLSSVLWSQQKYDQAAPILKKYIELMSLHDRKIRSSVAPSCNALGRYYLDQRQPTVAREWIERALRESPGDSQALDLMEELRRVAPATRP